MIFAVTSLLAVSVGCFVVASTGGGVGVWGRNAAAWVIGAVLVRLLGRSQPARLWPAVLLLTPIVLLMSVVSGGQSGVHRWIRLGPLNWNVAFLLLPAATVAVAASARRGWRWTWWAALVIELALCLQPDASQATAFAGAAILVLLTTRGAGWARATFGLMFALVAGIAWVRPDPLAPVPEVEGILALARTVSGGVAVLCGASLAAVCLSPLVAWKNGWAASALCSYFVGCALMPLLGAFPVPLVGMGMSPIIGFWLGVGALVGVAEHRTIRSVERAAG